MQPTTSRWEIRENEFMDDFEIWEGDRQIAGQLKRENAEAIVAAKERQGVSVDLIWQAEQDDLFNVVADIDLPSARIEYAFKAGYLASQSAPCAPCAAEDHALCYFWERRRWWSPCNCKHQAHEGKPVPVDDRPQPDEMTRLQMALDAAEGEIERLRQQSRDEDTSRIRLNHERIKYRDALELISRGVWTAPNSVESIVWTARQALKG